MKKLIIFFCSFSFVFLPTPILGIYTQNKVFSDSIFNYSYSLYILGVSSNKGKVVLGSNGWLFLGNDYDSVIDKSIDSYKQKSESISDNEEFLKKIRLISKENNASFKFVVFPNKHSIYGDNIGFDTSLDSYSYYNSHANVLRSDMTSYFRKLKDKIDHDLYFKTDTHWNDLGAFYGYQYIMSETLNENYNKLAYDTKFTSIDHYGGDLARFLNITEYVSDTNISVANKFDEKVIRINLATNEMSNENIQGKINNSEIREPIKVINKYAINTLKVLWLHDSFGGAMSPYMHLTFSEVTHQHYNYAFNDISKFEKLVKDVRPDIVILSGVERNSLDFGRYLNN